jgi:hypothetical protein
MNLPASKGYMLVKKHFAKQRFYFATQNLFATDSQFIRMFEN